MEQARNYVCKSCATAVPSSHKFCGACGVSVPPDILELRTKYFGAMQSPGTAQVVVIRTADGSEGMTYSLQGTEHVLGRTQGEILFPNDPWVSETHARLKPSPTGMTIEDEGSQNGVYVRVLEPVTLQPGDHFLCGEQLFILEGSLPEPSSESGTEQTYFYSSPKRPSPFCLVQVLEGGDQGMRYCAREHAVTVGREDCHMNFIDDVFMSGSHAKIEVTPEGAFTLTDLDSKNGTYVKIDGTRELKDGDYLFVGKELLRVELTA